MKKVMVVLAMAGALLIPVSVLAKVQKSQRKKTTSVTKRISKTVDCPDTVIVNGISFEMVKVEGGTFEMGATPDQGRDTKFDESPAHQVALRGYSIAKTPVTQRLWVAVMGENPSSFKGDSLPVDHVSWNDCQLFIKKLNSLTGLAFRLPTEAEWEFAARGGNCTKGYMYAGGNDIDSVAWYGVNSAKTTHPVGLKSPNELGLYDMSGNLWEWCSDWFGDYQRGLQRNPKGVADGFWRSVRGGSWIFEANGCRVASRRGYEPDERSDDTGFRLAH